MDCYSGKYGMVLANPYKHIQHKAFYPPPPLSQHRISPPLAPHSQPPPQQTRVLRKSIIPYAGYAPPPPPPPMYYTSPPPHRQMVPSSPPSRTQIINHPRPRSVESAFRRPEKAPTSPPSPRLSKKFAFTAKDIDAVLYGYLGDENNKNAPFHSLSGLRINSNESSKNVHEQPIHISHPGLPSSLTIKEIRLGRISHTGVFAKETIQKGTRFGPFQGKVILPRDLDSFNSQDSWEVFNNGKLVHYVSAAGCHDNWMKFVNCARYTKEQNMCVIQKGLEIYYETSEEIKVDQELLTWYGEGYTKYMEIPISMKTDEKENSVATTTGEDVNERKFLIDITDSNNAGSYPCNRCGKIFSYAYYREKHLKYTRCVDKGDRKFPCHLCQRSFEKKDRLRIHILHVHQKYRPHVCKTCGKRFSQSSSLNKHSRVHTGERPYACPHCPKSFTASSILRTHLRQHNGERPFKCKFCGKTFASHAAHDSHVKRTHEKLKTHCCHVCKKTFSMEFELKFHLSTHTMVELEDAAKMSVTVIDEPFDTQGNRRGRAFSEESDGSLIIDIEEGIN